MVNEIDPNNNKYLQEKIQIMENLSNSYYYKA